VIDVADLIVKLAALVEPNLPEVTPAELVRRRWSPVVFTRSGSNQTQQGGRMIVAGPADLRSTVRGSSNRGESAMPRVIVFAPTGKDSLQINGSILMDEEVASVDLGDEVASLALITRMAEAVLAAKKVEGVAVVVASEVAEEALALARAQEEATRKPDVGAK
jgi:hypothetical protein